MCEIAGKTAGPLKHMYLAAVGKMVIVYLLNDVTRRATVRSSQHWKAAAVSRRSARRLARAGNANEHDCLILTLCLVRLEMLLDMAWSQSKQSSAVANWTSPLQTPSTAMTWNAFFLKGEMRKNRSRRVLIKPGQIRHNLSEQIWEFLCKSAALRGVLAD